MKRTANQLLTKSVPSPCAQTATLCDFPQVPLAAFYSDFDKIMTRKDIAETDKAIIELVILGGFRISSLLRLQSRDVMHDLSIMVKQDKGSSSILFTSVYCRDFWRRFKQLGMNPFYGLSRFYYYRLFIKLGLSMRFEGNKNHSVTHLGRHMRGLNLKGQNICINDKESILGHKNIKNMQYYEKDIAKHQTR
jgi:integrase